MGCISWQDFIPSQHGCSLSALLSLALCVYSLIRNSYCAFHLFCLEHTWQCKWYGLSETIVSFMWTWKGAKYFVVLFRPVLSYAKTERAEFHLVKFKWTFTWEIQQLKMLLLEKWNRLALQTFPCHCVRCYFHLFDKYTKRRACCLFFL